MTIYYKDDCKTLLKHQVHNKTHLSKNGLFCLLYFLFYFFYSNSKVKISVYLKNKLR